MPDCTRCGKKTPILQIKGNLCPECRAKENMSKEDYSTLSSIILTTEMQPQGLVVTERHGVITAECVFGMNVFKDLLAGARDIFGGRSASFQNTLRDARETTLNELRKEAHERGANAVIAIDLDYSEISTAGSMLMMVASGTAVSIEHR